MLLHAFAALSFFFFFFNATATTEIYTLSLHDALPIFPIVVPLTVPPAPTVCVAKLVSSVRSEEHTSELQSHSDLVCRLLLEKKKKKKINVRNKHKKLTTTSNLFAHGQHRDALTASTLG